MNRPPRSSLAIALEDYKGPRPGIALTIAAVFLLAAIVIGVIHVAMLGKAGNAIEDGSQTIRTLNGYNAALEVWRQLAADPSEVTPQEAQLRDSIALALQRQFTSLRAELEEPTDQQLVDEILLDRRRELQISLGRHLGRIRVDGLRLGGVDDGGEGLGGC